MKKRRVLALLLALSLSVSTNSMAVLASETGGQDVSAIAEEAGEIVEGETHVDDQKAEDSIEDNESDGQGQDQDEIPGGEDQNHPGESGDEQDQEDGNDVGNPDGYVDDDDSGDGEDAANPDDGIGFEEPEEIPVEAEEISDEMKEETSSEGTLETKMVTFTDATGLKITYDAVAAVSYEPSISDGVLAGIPDAEGVIDLRDEQITSIGTNAFKNNTKITYVMLPSTVKSIEFSAFMGCTALRGVSISYGLTSVGENAFKNCTALTQLALPNSVTTIGTSAFENDSKLFMLHMVSAGYSKLKTIGNSAFKNCTSLELFCSDEEYNLPASITTIGESAFENCSKIKNITINDNVISLGQKAYKGCSGIGELTLSSGLTIISQYAFADCISLEKVVFGNANIVDWTTIDEYAFSNCSKLSNLELPDQINKVCSNAFSGCTALRRIEIDNTRATLDSSAFPNENRKDDMCIVGKSGSTAYIYAENANIRFIATNEVGTEFYTYKVFLSGAGTDTVPKITAKVTTKASYSSSDKDINNIDNGVNANKGVEAGTICYFYYEMNTLTNIQLVPGSVKVNGIPLISVKNTYSFAMPVGGATITAEFEYVNPTVVVDGDEKSIEGRLSSEADYDANTGTGHLKVGQSAKFYLTNSNSSTENRIAASKITYGISSSSEKGVVSIDANGTVKALKVGTAVVTARVQTKTGDIYKTLAIKVEKAGINHISILVSKKDSYMTVIEDEETGKATGLSVPTEKLTRNYTFDLKAVAFSMEEDSEEMAVALTWTTSDAKVAKLAKSSTTTASSVNTITIPKNTDGEATITVTATDENKNKITQKFVVSAQSYKPRLAETKVTINPNQVDYTTKLEIVSAYGKTIKTLNEDVKILDAKTKVDFGDFALRYEESDSSDSVFAYGLRARSDIKEASYSVLVRIKVMEVDYDIPLTIVVKKSIPSPMVTFDKKQQKINLFYKSNDTTINPIISKLGTNEVSNYSLQALSSSEYDVRFTENFEINPETGTITRKAEELGTNKSGKPVVTGYLVLRFKNYKNDVEKKYKITIPTETVAPSYVLNKTSATYNKNCTEQTIELQLLNKKEKNTAVKLSKSEGYRIEVVDGSGKTRSVTKADINEDGKIELFMAENPIQGKVYLKLENDSWAQGKSFTYVYTIKTNTADPALTLTDGPESSTTLKNSTLTINPNYKERTMVFGLKSNQGDTVISGEQKFIAQSSEKTAEEYKKLSVTYVDGIGHVSINKNGEDIKPGTYTFVCAEPQCTIGKNKQPVKKVILKVNVAKSVPTVTAKGSLSFNTQVINDGQFIEKGELTLTTKNLPENYTIDDETLNTIVCTTKNYGGYANNFNWEIVQTDNPLVYSLKVSMNTYCKDGTYTFSITPKFTNGKSGEEKNTVALTKAITFSVKVYHGNPTVSLSAKGKLNLLDRSGKHTASNSIIYTPTIKNVKDTVKTAKIFDADGPVPTLDDDESDYFEVEVIDGKLYVSPKADVVLEHNKTYKVDIWMKLTNYNFGDSNGMDQGGIWNNKTLSIKTSQVLPKSVTDKSTVNLYLSNKNYEATFIVNKKDTKVIGAIESIAFGEKDTKALESFVTLENPDSITGKNIVIYSEPQDDGSLKVKLKLKNGVVYGCNTTNKITMYVRFAGQGSNTAGTAISMNVKINK